MLLAAPAPEIQAVEIVGAGDVDAEAIVVGLVNRPPSGIIFDTFTRLEPLALEADRRRVESQLRGAGYFNARVEPAEVEAAEEGRVKVTFRVELGPVARIREVRVNGLPGDPGFDARALLVEGGLEEGAVFAYPKYVAAKEHLRAALFRRGWARAKVGGRVEIARGEEVAVVELSVDSGPLVHFGEAHIVGTSSLPAESLEARVAWTPGDRFDPERLRVTERRIYQLSLAGAVRFELAGEGEVADVEIHASDASRNELRLGGGVAVSSHLYELRGRAGYVRRSFLSPLNTFRAEVKPSVSFLKEDGTPNPGVEARGEIQRDDFLIPRLTLTTGIAFQAEQLEVYGVAGPSAYLVLSTQVLDDAIVLAVRTEWSGAAVLTKLGEVERADVGITSPLALLFVAPSIAYDTRDDLLAPRRGVLLRAELEVGTNLAADGPGGSYLKLGPEARAYLPLFTPRIVGAAKLRFGASLLDAPLPITRRYFAGGSESQRGFGRRQLSPRRTAVVDEKTLETKTGPVGGEVLVEASLELRFEVVKLFGSWLGLVAFVDAADARAKLSLLDLGDLHVAAGPGLRYQTPVGPIRIDFGFRLNHPVRVDGPEYGTWAFHLSLGEAF